METFGDIGGLDQQIQQMKLRIPNRLWLINGVYLHLRFEIKMT